MTRPSNIAEWKAEPLARRDLLLQTYDYIQHHSCHFFQNTQSGVIISKLKGILDGYDYILNLHHTLGRNFSIVIVSIFVLFFVNSYVFIFILIWCALFITIMYSMGLNLNQISNEYAESKHQIIGFLSDNITNIFNLFYFAKRKVELDHTDIFMSSDCVPKHIALEKADFKFCIIGSILYWLMLISVFLFMIYLRKNSNISTGDLIFALLTTTLIILNLWEFISGLCDFLKKLGDFKSSFSILSMPHEQIDDPSAKDIKISSGDIEFKNLFFSYE